MTEPTDTGSGPYHLQLRGTAADIGHAHGALLAEAIDSAVDFYVGLFGLAEDDLRQRALAIRARARLRAPALAAEVDAIAAGSGQPLHRIWALNARSELLPFAAPECTAALLPRAAVQGQTWDWAEPLEPLLTVLEITRPDGLRLLTLTEPGIVGKIGLNSAGLGVTLNFLPVPGALDGLPVHLVLRGVLEADSLAAARGWTRGVGTGRGGNVLVGSAAGGFNVEYAGPTLHVTEVVDAPFVHTNHCLVADVRDVASHDNSAARLDTAAAAVAGLADAVDREQALGGLADLFSDQGHPQYPVCRPYQGLHGMQLGTVCTVLMDLAAGALHLRTGPHPEGSWQVFAL